MDNEKAKRIRNAHRAFVEKTIEGATRILVEQTADHAEDSSREKLMGLKFTLNERLETIEKLDETILENTKGKGRDIEKEVEDCGEFCAKVYRILARIDLSLEDAKNSVHVGTSPCFSQINNNVKSNEGAKVKLPKLELKSFSGNYDEWQNFWDIFESAVNRNTDISRIQKFTYLKSCVTAQPNLQLMGCLSLNRGTQRGYSSKPPNIALLNVF